MRAQFHISVFIFIVTDGISLKRSAKCESIMSSEHTNVQLTNYQCACIMPLPYTKLLVGNVGHFAHYGWHN